jgi:hypothetical protein
MHDCMDSYILTRVLTAARKDSGKVPLHISRDGRVFSNDLNR